jgi:hypothetical protein
MPSFDLSTINSIELRWRVFLHGKQYFPTTDLPQWHMSGRAPDRYARSTMLVATKKEIHMDREHVQG